MVGSPSDINQERVLFRGNLALGLQELSVASHQPERGLREAEPHMKGQPSWQVFEAQKYQARRGLGAAREGRSLVFFEARYPFGGGGFQGKAKGPCPVCGENWP